MLLAFFEYASHSLSARLEMGASSAPAAHLGEKTDEELVASEDAERHRLQRQGVWQRTRAVELHAIGEQEQADLRPRDRVVAVCHRVHDRLVDRTDRVLRVIHSP